MKKIKYPPYINPVSYKDLDPGFREYMLRLVSYYGSSEGNIISRSCLDKAIKEWVCCYGAQSDRWLYEANGFASAVEVHKRKRNCYLKNDGSFGLFVMWVKKIWWECSVENDWLQDPLDEKEFNMTLGWNSNLLSC